MHHNNNIYIITLARTIISIAARLTDVCWRTKQNISPIGLAFHLIHKKLQQTMKTIRRRNL